METIAENKTVITQRLFSEAMTAAGSYRKAAGKSALFLGLLGLAFLGYTLWAGQSPAAALMELVLLSAVCVWLLILYPGAQNRRAYRAMTEKYGKNPERKILFYEDSCRIETGSSTVTIPYGDIVCIRRTRRLLVLTCRDQVGVMISLSGFSRGSAETVESQIRKIQEEIV